MRNLNVRLCRTRKDNPLAVVDNLPGHGSEFTPDELRALAKTFNLIADDSERCFMVTDRVYSVKK